MSNLMGAKLAAFLIAIRARARGIPHPASPASAVTSLVGLAVIPGPQSDAIKAILAALLRPKDDYDFPFRQLAALENLALGSFDCLIEGLLDGSYTVEALRDVIGPIRH